MIQKNTNTHTQIFVYMHFYRDLSFVVLLMESFYCLLLLFLFWPIQCCIDTSLTNESSNKWNEMKWNDNRTSYNKVNSSADWYTISHNCSVLYSFIIDSKYFVGERLFVATKRQYQVSFCALYIETSICGIYWMCKAEYIYILLCMMWWGERVGAGWKEEVIAGLSKQISK